MTTKERIERAKTGRRRAKDARDLQERREKEIIRRHLAGTSWGPVAVPLSATDRSRRFRERGRDLGELPKARYVRIRRSCRHSLLKFGLTFCLGPDKMLKRRPSPRMERFVNALQETVLHGGNRHVRWPRGKGKSTWLKIAALWALVYGHRRFVLILAATKPMAEEATTEIWRFAAEDERFAAAFPEISVPLADAAFNPQRMRVQTYKGRKTHLTENVRYSYRRFAQLRDFPNTGGILAARGADQAIRGLNIGSIRPDFIFIDDPQTDESAASPSQTAKIEARIQGAVLGLGDTNRTCAAVMASTPIEPDDISERYADPERHSEWLTTTEKLVVRFGPKEMINLYLQNVRLDNAAQDVKLTRSRAFYIEHRAEIEDGVEMMDDADFDPALEVSAYHHALNRLHLMKEKAFYAECQMQPSRAQGVYRIEPVKVAQRLTNIPFGTIPPECDQGILAFCDVNDVVGLRWEIMAFGKGRVTATLAYGRYPERGPLYPEGTPPSAVPTYLAPALRKVAEQIAAARFVGADGEMVPVRGICFDGGWQTETVALVVSEIRAAGIIQAVWSKGYSSTQYSRYHHDKAASTKGLRAAEECHTWVTPNGMYLAYNADYWREVAQTSFLAPPLSPSSSALWGSDSALHYDFATEVCAETLLAKESHPRYGNIWVWKENGPNHFCDTHSGCMVYGAIRGNFDPVTRLAAGDLAMAANLRKRRKVRYVYE